jgi:putative transposase
VILGDIMALEPTPEQAVYLRRACRTARFCLQVGAGWVEARVQAGEKPSAGTIKCRWNAHRKAELPWSYEVTKCASGQVIMDLGAAFFELPRWLQEPKKYRHFRYPKFTETYRWDQ